jgi:putative membrane protein
MDKSKTIVICVDRDNDMGEKAGLDTPIIGKEASLSAATKLALADSEDSDVNAIFNAISLYDRLVEEDVEAEIVLVAGDKKVGVTSDRKIGKELDEVLSKLGSDTAILVSDGAEDESIVPIIQSRVKIDSVRRVVVKQSEHLESTFYVIKRLFEDPKFSRTFLPPVGLFLFLLAFSLLFGMSGQVMGLVLAFLGIYMLLKGLGRENILKNLFESAKQSLYSGKITIVVYICAVVLILVGTSKGILGIPQPESSEHIFLGFTSYVKGSIWWYVGAALAPIIGGIINMLIEGEKIVRQWTILFSVIASGLVIWGGSECITLLLRKDPLPLVGYQYLFFSILGAICLYLAGVRISGYARDAITKREREV